MSLRLSDAHGEFRGVVPATLRAQYFVDLYRSIDVASQGVIGMVKRDGTLLVMPRESAQNAGLKLSRSPVLRAVNEDGVKRGSMVLTAMIDSVKRIYGFDSSDEYPILVAAALAIANQGSPYANLTQSIGVASCVPGQAMHTPAERVAAANVALYAAKSKGRNRVVLSQQPA